MTSIIVPPRTAPGQELRARLAGLARDRADEAPWVRLALPALAILAAILYTVNLAQNGYANSYYSAAGLAGSQSWSAWFFGSLDAGNFITVDKPPLAVMVMGLSVRLFGLSSASVLLPQALMGVATVVVLFLVVRRSFGPVAALVAGLVMALTPVAAIMFRFNQPDALLTLLLVLAAYAFVRALEHGRLRWVVAAAVFVGLAFNTKYLQAYLVLPAFAITWLIAAPVGLRRRLAGILVAAAAVLVSSGWWILAVELIPAAARPYIGGSTNNSALDLIFGYDGLARLLGGGAAGGGGATGNGGSSPTFAGSAGLLRLFNAELGGQISWLIPFSLVGLAGGVATRLRRGRTDRRLAGYLMWGLWLVVTGLVFSLMTGTIHPYYAVALAPAIAALVGAGFVDLWALRSRVRFGGLALAGAIVATAWWGWQLLDRAPDFAPGLGLAAFVAAVLFGLVIAAPASAGRRWIGLAAAGLGLAVTLAGPAAYTLQAITTASSGTNPMAGPIVSSGGMGGPGGPGGSASLGGGFSGGFVGGAAPAGDGAPAGGSGPAGGGAGTSDSALLVYLVANKGDATWIVAVDSAMSAAPIELATGEPVMGMGGFTGSDPTPTLDQLKAYVGSGQLRYVILGGGNGAGLGGGSRGASGSEISAWVTSVGTVVDYGGSGATLYDLSGARTAAS